MTHRILVVEDDQDIGDLLQESLSRAGYEVLRAMNGEQARFGDFRCDDAWALRRRNMPEHKILI